MRCQHWLTGYLIAETMWKLLQLAVLFAVMWGCQHVGMTQEPDDGGAIVLGFMAAFVATALLSTAIDFFRARVRR
jgi:hypothetical protein